MSTMLITQHLPRVPEGAQWTNALGGHGVLLQSRDILPLTGTSKECRSVRIVE